MRVAINTARPQPSFQSVHPDVAHAFRSAPFCYRDPDNPNAPASKVECMRHLAAGSPADRAVLLDDRPENCDAVKAHGNACILVENPSVGISHRDLIALESTLADMDTARQLDCSRPCVRS